MEDNANIKFKSCSLGMKQRIGIAMALLGDPALLILDELEKIATHYGIIRHGKMIREMTSAELEASCRTYVALRTKEMSKAKNLLGCKYSRVEEDEAGCIRIYDQVAPEEIVTYLYKNGHFVSELKTAKIGLEEYYMDLMKEGR